MSVNANVEESLANAQLELDAIVDSDSEYSETASAAAVNLQAAIANPDARAAYVEEAQALVTELVYSLDPDGAYHGYAQRAKAHLDDA